MMSEMCEQAVSVQLLSSGQLQLGSRSIGTLGMLGGHGKLIKLTMSESDEVLGGAVRYCLNNRNLGYRQYQMHTEKEAFQATLAEHHKDRGEASDKKFYKGTKLAGFWVHSDHILVTSSNNTTAGHGAQLKDPAPIQLPLNASNLALASALRLALERSLA